MEEATLNAHDGESRIQGRYFEAGQKMREGTMDDTMSLESRLKEAGPFDIVVGISTKNVETTIIHVLNVVCEGLQSHFPAMKSLVVVSDGYSEDQTVPLAEFFPTPRGIQKVVATQKGGPGKGNGIHTVLEIANLVDAHAVALVDGDLVSLRPTWMDNLLRPILHGLTDVVVPYYLRDKWDGVITNHLCYPFTAALYGSSVRQPIGGEYALSRAYYKHLLERGDVPEDFGIDIYLTITAIAEGFRIQEAPLGIKIHASTTGYTDPRKTLSRMYLEVVGALLDMAERYEDSWRVPRFKSPVLLSENVISYYDRLPPSTSVNEEVTHAIFTEGLDRYDETLRTVLPQDVYQQLQESREGGLEAENWARTVYMVAAWYIANPDGIPREEMLHSLGALGMGRFLHFVHETKNMDLQEASKVIQQQARTFQELRPDFVRRVDELRRSMGHEPGEKKESAKA